MRKRTMYAACLCVTLAVALGAGKTSFASEGSQPPQTQTEDIPLYVVVYRPGSNWKSGIPMAGQALLEHFYHLRDLNKKGRVVLAGPVGAEGGLVIFRARDQASANAFVAADPAVVSRIFEGHPQPFVARLTSEQPLTPVRP